MSALAALCGRRVPNRAASLLPAGREAAPQGKLVRTARKWTPPDGARHWLLKEEVRRVATDRSDMGRRSRAALADEDESHPEVNESATLGGVFAYERIAARSERGRPPAGRL